MTRARHRALAAAGALAVSLTTVIAGSEAAAAAPEPLQNLRGSAGSTVLPQPVEPPPNQSGQLGSGVQDAFVVPESSGEFRERDGFTVVVRTPPPPVDGGVRSAEVVRPVGGVVSSLFGPRLVAGCDLCSTNHRGLDFAAPAGSPVVAAARGTVIQAAASGGYGLSVLIRHDDGLITRSAHLRAIETEVGAHVDAGEHIGLVGSTGISTGPHLHFETIRDGAAVDPAPWLASFGVL